MVQVIQIKRKTTGAGVPLNLEPGELAYNTTGHTLVVGDASRTVQPLIGPTRQVEIAGDQTITGNKTIAPVNLKITGGAVGNLLSTDGAGTLSWADAAAVAPPVVPATGPEMVTGTRNDVFGTPLNTASLTGASVTTLATTQKTLVPAINELKTQIDLLASGTLLVGKFDAAASLITWIPNTGTGNVLPPADAANAGWYLICDEPGTVAAGGVAPAGTYENGDWVISNGTAWLQLTFGGISSVTATAVTVNPAVAGGTNVQAVLTTLDTDLDAVVASDATKLPLAGGTCTGPIYIPITTPLVDTEVANKKYVDDTATAAAGGTTVTVVGPELSGNGLSVSPITFNGIGADTVYFGGDGLSATPLTLLSLGNLSIDGGTYA